MEVEIVKFIRRISIFSGWILVCALIHPNSALASGQSSKAKSCLMLLSGSSAYLLGFHFTGEANLETPKVSKGKRIKGHLYNEYLRNLAEKVREPWKPVFLEASTNLSQHIRDNQSNWWNSFKVSSDLIFQGLPSVLRSEGVVIGDFHAGNIQYFLAELLDRSSPARSDKEVRKLVYSLFDIKDLGHGAYLGDVGRYIMNYLEVVRRNYKREGKILSSEETQEKFTNLLESYILGLGKEDFTLTNDSKQKFVRLKIPGVKKFKKQLAHRSEKMIDAHERLKRKGNSRELKEVAVLWTLTETELLDQIQGALAPLVPDYTVVDAYSPIPERGGGVNATRFLVLLMNSEGKMIVKELKEHIDPGVLGFGDQPSVQVIREQAGKALGVNLLGTFPMIKVANRMLDVRDKKIEVVPAPNSWGNKRVEGSFKLDDEFAADLAFMQMEFLGTYHGRQMNPNDKANYANTLDLNKKEIGERFLPFFTAYVRTISLPKEKNPEANQPAPRPAAENSSEESGGG